MATTDEGSVSSLLSSIAVHRETINVNWNGQNPDLMTPDQLAAIHGAIQAIANCAIDLAVKLGSLGRHV